MENFASTMVLIRFFLLYYSFGSAASDQSDLFSPLATSAIHSTAASNAMYTIKASRKLASSAGGFVGEIVTIPFSTVPNGFVECDGRALDRNTYPDLFNAIGDLYGLGSVINTFKVPDYRGYALRALDNGAGIDPNRVIGSKQEDMFETHFHIVPRTSLTPSGIDGIGAGIESGGTPDNNGMNDGGFPFKTLRNSDGGGSETRMKNVAVKFIIRALPTNDIAQTGVNTFEVCDVNGANCFEPSQIAEVLTQMSLLSADISSLKTEMGTVETYIRSFQSWSATVNTKLDNLSSRGAGWDGAFADINTRFSRNEDDIATLHTDVDITKATVDQLVPDNLNDTDDTLTRQQRQLDMQMYWILALTLFIVIRLVLDLKSYANEISERSNPQHITPAPYPLPEAEKVTSKERTFHAL
jgi:hypothetical protein